jgi:hypothetical protein
MDFVVQCREPDGTLWTIPESVQTGPIYVDVGMWIEQVKAERAERMGWVRHATHALPAPPVTGRYAGAGEWARGGGQRMVDGDVVAEWYDDGTETSFEAEPNRLAGVGAFVLFALAIVIVIWAGSGATVPAGG